LQTFVLHGQELPYQREIQRRKKSVRLWSGSISRLDLSFVIVQLKTASAHYEFGKGAQARRYDVISFVEKTIQHGHEDVQQ